MALWGVILCNLGAEKNECIMFIDMIDDEASYRLKKQYQHKYSYNFTYFVQSDSLIFLSLSNSQTNMYVGEIEVVSKTFHSCLRRFLLIFVHIHFFLHIYHFSSFCDHFVALLPLH